MGLTLGIDTGGTYTDAVLVDKTGHVHSSAKALTSHDDLSRGIGEAFDGARFGLRHFRYMGLFPTRPLGMKDDQCAGYGQDVEQGGEGDA